MKRLRWYQLIVPLVRGFWVIVVKDYLRTLTVPTAGEP
jgi:hypothetical protein